MKNEEIITCKVGDTIVIYNTPWYPEHAKYIGQIGKVEGSVLGLPKVNVDGEITIASNWDVIKKGTSKSSTQKLRKRLSKKLRFKVFSRDSFTCQYCGKKPPKVILHIDHKLALFNGGTNKFENLVTACAECNLGKGVLNLTT